MGCFSWQATAPYPVFRDKLWISAVSRLERAAGAGCRAMNEFLKKSGRPLNLAAARRDQ